MRGNQELRIHVINVGHGDSILVEFPDCGNRPRFGLVDAGGEDSEVKGKTLDYVDKFIEYRLERPPSGNQDAEDYVFEFVCLTHPHKDHYYGMLPLLASFCGDQVPAAHRPRQFWDCGFRYNTLIYLSIRSILSSHREVQFVRLAAGSEFHYDDVEVVALAPSIDLRNRYDTWGVDLNNASIVLRLTHGRGVAILTGDAEFDSWGKVCEEFPRKKHLSYPPADRRDPTARETAYLSQQNQLNCQFLKVSHHGSKHGTSLEYLEKLTAGHFAITCDEDAEYTGSWKGGFPHPLTRLAIDTALDSTHASSGAVPALTNMPSVGSSSIHGTMIYAMAASGRPRRSDIREGKHDLVTSAQLDAALSNL